MNKPEENLTEAQVETPEEIEFKEALEETQEEMAFKGILYEHPKRKHIFIVIIFVILCLIFSSIFWFSKSYNNLLWVSKNSVFEKHEYWRIFTALFTHADFKHLLSNMPLFILFGWFLRNYFGLLAFPLAAFVAGALANIATLYFYPEHTQLIGASGVVYALVGLWVTFYVRYEIRYSFAMKLFRAVGFSMVLLLPTSYQETTSYLAHAFGFLFGIICALIIIKANIYNNNPEIKS